MVSRAQIPKQIEKSPKKWIQEAIGKPGAFRAELNIPKGKKIPKKVLKKATRSKNPTTRRRANLAITLGKLRKKKRRS
jgi:hypothetical protein